MYLKNQRIEPDMVALLQGAGISEAEIPRSAPAKFVGLPGQLGSVAEGKTVSLILLRVNRLAGIGRTFIAWPHHQQEATSLSNYCPGAGVLVVTPGCVRP